MWVGRCAEVDRLPTTICIVRLCCGDAEADRPYLAARLQQTVVEDWKRLRLLLRLKGTAGAGAGAGCHRIAAPAFAAFVTYVDRTTRT